MTRRRWTDDETDQLVRRFPTEQTAAIARDLDRTVTQVYSKAHSLGLKKSQAYLDSPAAGRLMPRDPRGEATRFEKGQKPWNKGASYTAGGRSAETRFKRGTQPHNELAIGSYRINACGYLDRKVSAEPGPNHLRWHPVHRLVWEEANGPVPAGHVVVFKPGRRSTELELITLDAVELITRRQLLDRNSRHNNYPPEINELIHLRAVLTRQINKREKA